MNQFNLNDLVTDTRNGYTGRILDVWTTEEGIMYHVLSEDETRLINEKYLVRCY